MLCTIATSKAYSSCGVTRLRKFAGFQWAPCGRSGTGCFWVPPPQCRTAPLNLQQCKQVCFLAGLPWGNHTCWRSSSKLGFHPAIFLRVRQVWINDHLASMEEHCDSSAFKGWLMVSKRLLHWWFADIWPKITVLFQCAVKNSNKVIPCLEILYPLRTSVSDTAHCNTSETNCSISTQILLYNQRFLYPIHILSMWSASNRNNCLKQNTTESDLLGRWREEGGGEGGVTSTDS